MREGPSGLGFCGAGKVGSWIDLNWDRKECMSPTGREKF